MRIEFKKRPNGDTLLIVCFSREEVTIGQEVEWVPRWSQLELIVRWLNQVEDWNAERRGPKAKWERMIRYRKRLPFGP